MTRRTALTPGRRFLGWWRADRGSATAELTVLVPVLVMLLLLVAVVVHRGVDTRIRLYDVAHQAARAASLERSTVAAVAAAQTTTATALEEAGISCRDPRVSVDASALRPGGRVSATVSCDVDLSDAVLLGVAGTRRLSAVALEPVDTWRSFEEGG